MLGRAGHDQFLGERELSPKEKNFHVRHEAIERLEVAGPAAGVPNAGEQAPAVPSPMSRHERDVRLRGLIDRYINFVARVLRNAGVPDSQIDDDVQRTFIAVARRLDDVRVGSEKSFLLQSALRIAAHARRTVARRREVHSDEMPESANYLATPEDLTDQKRARQLLDHVLSQMETDLRTVFLLYEFEELSMAEIAAALRIPPGTVASRLRRARADFRERVSVLEGRSKAEVGS
jgi:RNA polymerase sigma-70 factor (ECF subfamily)